MSCGYQRVKSLNAKTTKPKPKPNLDADKPTFTAKFLIQVYHELLSQGRKAPGPDNLTFDKLADYQWKRKASSLSKAINKNTYQPGPTKLARIPKSYKDGFREIQIPNTIDKIANRACLIAMSPLVDKLLLDWCIGFRPKKSYHDILEQIRQSYEQGYRFITHYDIKDAFNQVEKRKLLSIVRDLPLKPDIKALATTLIIRNEPEKLMGLNQGEALSGHLFNIYIHSIHDTTANTYLNSDSKLFRYADDFCIIGRSKEAVEELAKKSIGLLSQHRMTCSYEEPVDLSQNKITLLGLTMHGESNNIRFTIPEASWTQLGNSLDEAHKNPDPITHLRAVTNGWIKAKPLGSLTSEDQSRLDSLLLTHGLNPRVINESPD